MSAQTADGPSTYEQALDFFDRYGGVGDVTKLRSTRPTSHQLDEAVRVAVLRHKQTLEEAVGHAACIMTHWDMNEVLITSQGLPKRQIFTRPVCPETPEKPATLVIKGELEFDWRRGVIYFHGPLGISHLRVCGLPKSDTPPKEDFQIDVTHMQGLSYVGK